MRQTIICNFMLLAAFDVTAASGSPADTIHLQFLPLPWSSTEKPEARYLGSDKALSTAGFDTRAEELLRTAKKFTGAIFELPLHFERAAAFQQGGDDMLLADWTIVSSGGHLYLRDAPYFSEYVLRVPQTPISSADDLNRVLSSILVYGKEPLRMGTDELSFAAGAAGGTIRIFSGGTIARSSLHPVDNIDIYGVLADGFWYVTVILPKVYTANYYSVERYVPERFPSLQERMNDWSTERIRSELGRYGGPPMLRDPFSFNRDRLLIDELIRRGLNEEQYTSLLVDNVPAASNGLRDRAGIVSMALSDAGKSDIKVQYLRAAIEKYVRFGPQAEDAVLVMFRVGAGRWAPQVEQTALETLRRGLFFVGPLDYISRWSSSEETLNTITGLSVPERADKRKAEAIKGLSKRIEEKR